MATKNVGSKEVDKPIESLEELIKLPETESDGEVKTAGGIIGYKALGNLPDA